MTEKRSTAWERVRTVVFMFAATFVAMSLVSGLHLATRERVEDNSRLFLRRAVMEASGIKAPESSQAILQWFDACADPISTSNAFPVFRITDSNRTSLAGYVLVEDGAGLWGRIRAVAGVDPERRHFTGVAFLEQQETPGLGARIEEEWYKKQFLGKSGPLKLNPEGTRSAQPDEIDAITGATITSKAVRDILNRVLKRAELVGQERGLDR